MTTRKDVEYMFDQYATAVEAARLLRHGYRLNLTIGSPSNGRPWEVHEVEADPTDGTWLRQPLVGSSLLGATATQAWETLWDRRRTILDILALQQRKENGFFP